ncbi:MAG TPA: DHA2 family efflux MFS transporter permease subunit [Candidatus Avamphibacillus intestinigallinarum]|nr:DHA2 family efflux MFS transporter permease subunit [Candidatus Avamphibacillus intestinigallinarum]
MKDRSAYVEPQNISKAPIIIVMVMGAFVAILNQTLLNVALPSLMKDLGISVTSAQWMTTIFMLVNGILIPISAFFMEKFTTRKLFLVAMGLFTLGTLICGIAPVFVLLLVGRVVQAAGAGIMMPLLLNVVLSLFPVAKRGGAMGLIGLPMMFAPAIGPTLSGWIVEDHSWRVLFFIVLPIALLDLILAYFFLRNVTETTNPKVDVTSIILSTLAFGGLLYGFGVAGDDGWTDPVVLTTLGIGAVAMIIFVARQLHIKTPMLEFRVFKYPMFSLTTIINLVVTMAMFSAMLLIPIYVQNVLGWSPLKSGLLLLPGALISAFMSPVTGMLFDKIGARPLALVGLGLTAITTYFFTDLSMDTTFRFMLLLYAARMIGISMIMMPIMTAGLNQLPKRLYSHGTAMANTLRQMAGAIGTAFLVTIMSTQAAQSAKDLAADLTAPPTKEVMLHIQNLSTIDGINHAFMVATVFAVIGFILSFFIKKTVPMEDEEPAN